MPEIGFALSSEDHGPSELVEQAAIAEQAGFTFAVISDHYHPWIRKQERTKEEGKRRLQRPALEEMSTALAAGFDIVAGIVVLALLVTQLEHHFGKHAAHVVGALGFGVGFIFLIVGRGELFTENFLVPIAGLDDEDDDSSWLSLLKLYLISPVFNVVGGLVTSSSCRRTACSPTEPVGRSPTRRRRCMRTASSRSS